VLTIYALFGDDFRLFLTEKPADFIFDWITIASMSIFAVEVIVCSIGKAEYVLSFFFWLDIMSTTTLLLDITFVAEYLFGDSISRGLESAATGGSNGASEDSTEAARAARMSRAGTKAGRMVRLIRVVRLIRFLKVFRKPPRREEQSMPGDYVEDDEDLNLSEESAVSKKLSEMTTRRVVVLVLVIMLSLPCFKPDLWQETLPTSAEYGAGVIYKRFRQDMRTYDPASNAAAAEAYLNSQARRIYVDDFFSFLYFHNPFCGEGGKVPDDKIASPLSSFGEVFWLGAGGKYVEQGHAVMDYMLPRYFDRPHPDLNARWNGNSWLYYQCDLTEDPIGLMDVTWNAAQECVSGVIRGLSLLRGTEGVVCPEELRYQERTVVQPVKPLTDSDEDNKNMFWIFVFDRRRGSQMEALLNSAQTIFMCLLLGFGALVFTRDANKLVLAPIERMITKLDKIRRDPLEAMAMGDHQRHLEQVAANRREQIADPMVALPSERRARNTLWERVQRWKDKLSAHMHPADRNVPEPMETAVLEKTIIKIGSLLALGFGEAGAEIIGQNMKGGDSAALDVMIPGRRVDCIFGFCDIRNFSDATEVLQDQVMLFVNRIASVVHSCITEFFGSPNKNMGEAFLLTWRLSGHVALKRQRLADMALISFVKIIAHTNKSPLLYEYRNHSKLLQRLPNYRVLMGFGLHSGWAIEGAIGSEFKIDASYLSPNVNMAARLEAMTKSCGCLILLSESLHQLMSDELAGECRLIDHVRLVGTNDPFKLYTLDLDDTALEVDFNEIVPKAGSRAEFKARFERQRRKKQWWNDDFPMYRLFDHDPDIQTMRSRFHIEHFCRFKMAYLNYEAGEWGVAKDMLESTRFLLGSDDGPSVAMLRYMRPFVWVAPKTWPGYRMIGVVEEKDVDPLDGGKPDEEMSTPSLPLPPLLPPSLNDNALLSATRVATLV